MVKRAWNRAICAALCICLLLMGAAAAEANNTIDYRDELVAQTMTMMDGEDGYIVGMHKRETAYNPSTVILSGSLFASSGMEITDVSVTVDGGYTAKGENLTRYEGGYPEETINQQLANQGASIGEIDTKRCGFIFTVDLSGAGLSDAEQTVNVTLKMANARTSGITVEAMATTAWLNSNASPVYDLVYELTGVPTLVIRNEESSELVAQLQANLQELNYMTAEQQTGVYDQTTRDAVRRLCAINDQVFAEDGVTMTLEKFIASGIAQAAPEDGFFSRVLDFLKKELSIASLSVPVWAIIAGAAGLVAIILTVILIATRKKSKPPRTAPEPTPAPMPEPIPAPIPEPIPAPVPGPVPGLDDSTVDLKNPQEDEKTVDLQPVPSIQYVIKIRLDFRGKFIDKESRISEGQEATIGRGEAATFRTHKDDLVVSHLHGAFRVINGKPCYVDTSKNGTMLDEKPLNEGETFELLPLSVLPDKFIRHRMALGDHRAYVIVYEEKPAPAYGGIVTGDPESEMTI